MTREEFRKYIRENIVILDGATGTNLMAAGMPVGVCPEEWVMEHPQVILDLQKAYVDNGTNIVYAPTFTGNRIKLLEYGLQEKINEINTTLVGLSKQAVGDRALVAADMTMTGRQLFPQAVSENLWISKGGVDGTEKTPQLCKKLWSFHC